MQGYDTVRTRNEFGELVEHMTVTVHRAHDGSFGLDLNEHNRITQITPGCPADFAGVKPYDLILRLQGELLTGEHSSGPLLAGSSLTHSFCSAARQARYDRNS